VGFLGGLFLGGYTPKNPVDMYPGLWAWCHTWLRSRSGHAHDDDDDKTKWSEIMSIASTCKM